MRWSNGNPADDPLGRFQDPEARVEKANDVGIISRDARIEAVHPVLMSSSVTASLQFFQKIGFREIFRDNPTNPRYAAVSRDGAELHLQWHESSQWSHPVDHPTYRFLVADVDRLYDEFSKTGALEAESSARSPWGSPGDTPWGTREFHLRDPDGNGLQFYQALKN